MQLPGSNLICQAQQRLAERPHQRLGQRSVRVIQPQPVGQIPVGEAHAGRQQVAHAGGGHRMWRVAQSLQVADQRVRIAGGQRALHSVHEGGRHVRGVRADAVGRLVDDEWDSRARGFFETVAGVLGNVGDRSRAHGQHRTARAQPRLHVPNLSQVSVNLPGSIGLRDDRLRRPSGMSHDRVDQRLEVIASPPHGGLILHDQQTRIRPDACAAQDLRQALERVRLEDHLSQADLL